MADARKAGEDESDLEAVGIPWGHHGSHECHGNQLLHVLTDADGKEYIDGISGLWNVVLGHGRHELVEAATKQMQELPYCSDRASSANQ